MAAASIVAVLSYALSTLVVGRGDDGYTTFWDGWVLNVALILPILIVGLYARRERRAPLAWWLVTLGIALNAIANLVYTFHDQNLEDVPFPASSDAAYLGSYLAFAVALILITQRQVGEAPAALRLDGLVIGLGSAAVAVALWFEPILAQSGSTAAVLVGMAYPLFDVVFLVIVIAGLAPSRFRPTWTAAAFMIGTLVFAAGDIIYLNQEAADTYLPGTLLDATWAVGILFFAVAPWSPAGRGRDSQVATAGATLLPALAASAALGVLALGLVGSVPALAEGLAIAALAGVLVRAGHTVHDLRRANEAFGQARTDDLTGLKNRRGFCEELDRQLSVADTVSLLIVDLDGFKEVNDSLGHQAGDALLQVVASRLLAAAPDGATVGRLGGDEFGIVLAHTHEHFEGIAEMVTDALTEPVVIDGMTIRVGASTGIAISPHHGTNRLELMRSADVAMYDAKNNQLGSAVYSDARDPHSRERLALIEQMRTAIAERSFDMHYQPTIDVGSGEVVGMEALIRWDHPERGMLAPEEFIPLAERVGLIPAITRAVVDISVGHLAETHRLGHEICLSVNISAKDLVDERLPEYVGEVLDAHQVAPHFLTLEITETALSEDTVRAERTLNALRVMGVRISIDDFGVGYSSLSQLLELPLDELKLDRSFIANLGHDPRAAAILAATVELGRTLGLDIVAEGVETVEELSEISRRGVDTAQGFLFSHALPAGEFSHYVQESGREVEESVLQ